MAKKHPESVEFLAQWLRKAVKRDAQVHTGYELFPVIVDWNYDEGNVLGPSTWGTVTIGISDVPVELIQELFCADRVKAPTPTRSRRKKQ